MPFIPQPSVQLVKYHSVVKTAKGVDLTFTAIWESLGSNPGEITIDSQTTKPDVGLVIPTLAGWHYEKGIFIPIRTSEFTYTAAPGASVLVEIAGKGMKRKIKWSEPKAGEIKASEGGTGGFPALAADEKIYVGPRVEVINEKFYGFEEVTPVVACEIVLTFTRPPDHGLAMLL